MTDAAFVTTGWLGTGVVVAAYGLMIRFRHHRLRRRSDSTVGRAS